MARYFRIYRTFFASSFARELEFRANFFAKIAQNAVWVFFFILILLVIYRNTNAVAGWSRPDAFMLAATCFIMSAVVGAFFLSLQEIPLQVRQGTLDFVITKPIDTQFWVSTRKFNFDQLGTLFAGGAMVGYGLSAGHYHPGLLQWFGYLVLVFASLILFYAFYMILMTLAIWLVKVDNLWVLGETVTNIARFPTDIYPLIVQRTFIYGVPLAFVATIPAREFVRGFEPKMVCLGVVWAVAAFAFSRWFWKFALRHYTSASS